MIIEKKTNEIATATIGRENYQTELQARTHTITADEPVVVGGKDLGPRPGDFIRMGLAACTAITLRMYANRKNMDVEQIHVSVSSSSETDKTLLHAGIQIKGNLTEEERTRLMQIAKKCPVHKMLTSPIQIDHTLTSEG